MVEGEEFIINYTLHNNGNAPARDIEITDRYDPTSFNVIDQTRADSTVTFNVDELGPGDSKRIRVTLVPALYGMYESTRAKVRYLGASDEVFDPAEDSMEQSGRVGYSTSLGRIRIISQAEKLRITTWNLLEWALFAAAFTAVTLVPFFQYSKVRAKNLSMTQVRKKVV